MAAGYVYLRAKLTFLDNCCLFLFSLSTFIRILLSAPCRSANLAGCFALLPSVFFAGVPIWPAAFSLLPSALIAGVPNWPAASVVCNVQECQSGRQPLFFTLPSVFIAGVPIWPAATTLFVLVVPFCSLKTCRSVSPCSRAEEPSSVCRYGCFTHVQLCVCIANFRQCCSYSLYFRRLPFASSFAVLVFYARSINNKKQHLCRRTQSLLAM